MGLSSLMVVSILLETLISQVKVGGPVVVTATQGRLMSERTLTGTAPNGTILVPEHVNSDWVWVTFTGPQGRVKGWISRKEILPLDEAIVSFTSDLRKKPTAASYAIRGTLWNANEQYRKAISDFSDSIRLDPKNPQVWADRGFAQYYTKDHDRAINDCSEAIKLDPKLLSAYKWRGLARASKGMFGDAAVDFSEALRLDPRDVPIRKLRGLAFVASGDVEKAIADYSEVSRLSPNDVAILKLRAEAWTAQQNYEQAIADLTEAARLDPKDDSAYDRLAWLLATCPADAHRDGRRAVEAATIACELTGWKNPYRIATLAAASAELGQFDEAAKWQAQAIELDRDGLKDHLRIRLELYKAGKPYRQS